MLWVAAAVAHPLSERHATQSTRLELSADHVDVDYVAEVPREVIATARRGGDPALAMGNELASGLVLLADGAAVPLTLREPVGPPEQRSEHTWAFTVRLTAPLARGTRALELSTANLPDVRSVYAGDVRVAPGTRLAACSLLHVRDGRVVRDDTLRWVADTPTLTVALASAEPRWWRWLAPAPDEPVRAAQALALGVLGRQPELFGALAAAGALLGAVIGRRPTALAVAALVVVAGALAGLPWRAVALAAVVSGIGALLRRGNDPARTAVPRAEVAR